MAAPYSTDGREDGITTCKNTQEGDMSDISAIADTHCNSTSTDERLDSVWNCVENEENKRTSPPKSPLEEAIDDDEIAKELSTSAYISPLMAPPIYTSNDTSLQPNNSTHLVSMSSNDTNSMIYSQNNGTTNQNNIQPIASNNANSNKQSLIQKYRTFLKQNQLSIDLFENVMERFVFYGYLFKEHDHSGISTELYYAIWNSIRWLNNVVLIGWGEGMGFTVGKRDEWLSHNCTSLSKEKRVSLSDSILLRLNAAVPILRAILTATTCIYPAMEAWSRRSTIHSSRALLDNGDNNSIIRRSRAAQVSYKLERIKFIARLTLLSISWWAQQHRRRNQQQDDDQQKERIPTLLRRGGELDPYEELVPLKDAEDEAKIVQYVGRRTGRRSIAARPSSTTPLSSPSSSQLSSVVSSSSIISNVTILIKRLARLLSSKHRILYVYAVGELLHILRPLYWSHAETRQYQKQRRSSSMNIQKQLSLNSSYSFGIWKAYFISLMMDLISDKLLQLSDGGGTSSSSSQSQRRGSLFGDRGSIGGRQSSSAPSPSAEQAKTDELDWRRSRHSLYLLRSPMYNTVTQPVATLLGRVVSMIPPFGLSQWAVEYVLDMMSYWNENHFMLES